MMVKQSIKAIISALGIEVSRKKPKPTGNIGKVGFLKHEGHKQGNALVSYIIEPYLLHDQNMISNAHDHDWASWQIGRTFSSFGYDVDAIDYLDRNFIPQKHYDFFIGARTNFQRLAELLPSDCIKIVYLDTSHWLFNNSADYRRHLELQQRRGITLDGFKWVEPNWAIEYADYATTLWGNQSTFNTYKYAGKPIFEIPLATCAVYPKPDNKDFDACRKHFLWFGSDGLIHKGLDLVLEAFAQLPDYRLTVCGPLRKSPQEEYSGSLRHDARFEAAFHHELYESSNIHTAGWIDVESDTFRSITEQCIGVIFPSCAEGSPGSVITCMQAGLIPIVSYETNVVVDDFGFILPESNVEEIIKSVRKISDLPLDEIKARAHRTWQFCRTHHTREKLAKRFRQVVEQIMTERQSMSC